MEEQKQGRGEDGCGCLIAPFVISYLLAFLIIPPYCDKLKDENKNKPQPQQTQQIVEPTRYLRNVKGNKESEKYNNLYQKVFGKNGFATEKGVVTITKQMEFWSRCGKLREFDLNRNGNIIYKLTFSDERDVDFCKYFVSNIIPNLIPDSCKPTLKDLEKAVQSYESERNREGK